MQLQSSLHVKDPPAPAADKPGDSAEPAGDHETYSTL